MSITTAAHPADIAAARKIGSRPRYRRAPHSGKLTAALPTAAQDRIVHQWVIEHGRDAFMIGNVVLLADARAYLHDLAERLDRAELAAGLETSDAKQRPVGSAATAYSSR